MFYSFAFLRYCITLNSVPGGGVVVVVVLAVVSFIISDRNIAGSSVEDLVEVEEDVSVVFSFVLGSG